MDVSDQGTQDGYALNNDGTNNFGRVPDVRMCISPEVPLVFHVPIILPGSSDRGYNGNHHSQTHGYAEADLFYFAHIQIPSNDPWKGCENEVHDNVVDISTLLKVVSELRLETHIKTVPVVITGFPADFCPLEEDFYDHVGIHAGDAEPENPSLPVLGQF